MGAYRCSNCNLNFSTSEACEVCGKTVWWTSARESSTPEEIDEAFRARVRDNPWSMSIDKVVNWRFEQLVAAGYDLATAEEIAMNRNIDLHDAIELAQLYGAVGARLRIL